MEVEIMLLLAPTRIETKLLMQLSSGWEDREGVLLSSKNKDLQILTLGMGREETEYTAKKFRLALLESSDVVLTGFCGGLNESVKSGDVVVVDEVVATRPELETQKIEVEQVVRLQSHQSFQQHIQRRVRLASVEVPLTTPEQKKNVLRETKADVVDMEAAFLLQSIPELKSNLLIVKVVLDEAIETLKFGDKGQLFEQKDWKKRGARIAPSLNMAIKNLVTKRSSHEKKRAAK